MQRYEQALAARPLVTNMVGSGVLFLFGDLVQQAIQLACWGGQQQASSEPKFSLVRAVRMALHGACVNATLYHVFLTQLKCVVAGTVLHVSRVSRRATVLGLLVSHGVLLNLPCPLIGCCSNGRIWGLPMPRAMRAVQQGTGWSATLVNVALDQTGQFPSADETA